MAQNPFKQLETQQEVPEVIKKKVMKNIESLKLIMEMGDLFSLKFGTIFENFLKTKK